MQCSVTVMVEVGPGDGISQVEERVPQAGRAAMRGALAAAMRACEEQHVACPRCGASSGEQIRSHGTKRRVVLTRCGRVDLHMRRLRCLACGQQFRPSQPCLADLGAANVTPELAAACALAGASWPYQTAARVLRELGGIQVSAEEVRQLSIAAGSAEAARQAQDAERLLTPTAADVRAERNRERGAPVALVAPVERLVVGLDGGWIPSREQAGGMEGKVGGVSTGTEPVGKLGRQRLTPRRYVASFGSSERVGMLAYAAATQLGAVGGPAREAREQFVLGDGATWIHTQAGPHFPNAQSILDWAYVERALHQAIRAACSGRANRSRRRDLHRVIPDHWWHGDVDATLVALTALRPGAPGADSVARLEATIRYPRTQRAWLGNYAAWQEAGDPIGSGMVERAICVVINRRKVVGQADLHSG
nr:hypothetical protein [Ktedonobacterales bacterium]